MGGRAKIQAQQMKMDRTIAATADNEKKEK